jgi:tyrosine-protein kinase Etk/Wzc
VGSDGEECLSSCRAGLGERNREHLMKFSEERKLFAAAGMFRDPPPIPAPERPALHDYSRLFARSWWQTLLIMILSLLVGGLVIVSMPPVYQANLLVQVSDPAGPPKGVLGESAAAFDVKTAAAGEMEIMRSRMIIGPAAEKNRLFVVAQPRAFFHAPGKEPIGNPTLLKLWVWLHAAQTIDVRQFEVPEAWEGQTFMLKSEGEGRYSLSHPALQAPMQGQAGELLVRKLRDGQLSLFVSDLKGPKGAEFTLLRKTQVKAMEDLQSSLNLVERGRQSGIIEATLRDADPVRVAAVLNAIGANYVRQDIERKSAEAGKTLAFLNVQLPLLKGQMDQAEAAYNKFRSRKGTLSFEDEARIAVARSTDLIAKVSEAQQRKRDLLSQLGSQHPAVKIVDEQISGLQGELRGIQGRISGIPATQQEAFALERDLKLSTDLYQQLRTSAMQMQLVRQNLTGNARIIDSAVAPDEPIRPRPLVFLGAAAAAGLVLSMLLVLIRSGFQRGVRSVREIEANTGMDVYSSAIPLGKAAHRMLRHSRDILALSSPGADASVGLRQLRTVLQHQIRHRNNNRLLITGPTEGVGVHFIGTNLAALLARGGLRVLLVEADLRRDVVARFFGVQGARGLAELVSGTCTWKEAIRRTEFPGLDILTAGSLRIHVDELAMSQVFIDALDRASREYDIVILTAPPVLRSAETLSIASTSAMIVLVARAEKTRCDEISESARRLSQAGQFPSGVVLNGV